MKTKAQKVRLGIFVTVSVVILIIIIGLVTGSKLLSERDIYYITYKNTSVRGLEVGGAVEYNGVNIGKVTDIKVNPNDVSEVIVKISVKEGTPIKKDVEANLKLVGITGMKLIELTGGRKQAELLEPGSQITAGKSLTKNITGKAEVISEKFERLLNNLLEITGGENKDKFVKLVERTNTSLKEVNSLIKQNKEPFNESMKNISHFSARLNSVVSNSNRALTRLDSVLKNVNSISRDLNQAEIAEMMKEINTTIKRANETFNHIDLTVVKSRRDILRSLELLKDALHNLNEVSRMLSEDPSILIRGIEQKKRRERR